MQAQSQRVTQSDAPDTRPPEASLNRRLRGRWLRRLFWFWIAGSAAVGTYLAVGGPLTPYTGLEKPQVALVVVPFNLLLLASGLTWLVLLVRSRR